MFGDALLFCGLGHDPNSILPYVVKPTGQSSDVSGIKSHLVNALRDRFQRKLVVEMNVGHQRDIIPTLQQTIFDLFAGVCFKPTASLLQK